MTKDWRISQSFTSVREKKNELTYKGLYILILGEYVIKVVSKQ